jgi:hypothetical protein
MRVFTFIERAAPFRVVDIMVQPLRGFADLYRRRLKVRYGDVSIPVLPLPALIRMKQEAGRPQDQQDLQFLSAIRRLQQRKAR